MLRSRALTLGRLVTQQIVRRQFGTTQPLKSGGTWVYRQAAAPAPKWVMIGAHCTGGLFWWWVIWHLWHESEHITGEFPWPDPSAWTNAELGIPPDEEGPAERIQV